MTTTRPKLELGLNETVSVKLLKDTPYMGRNAFGAYFLYSVEHQGTEKAFFADDEVHQKIVEGGLGAGDEFILRKVAVQNGKKIGSAIVIEPATVLPGNGKAKAADEVDKFKAIMEQSLLDAVDLTRSIEGIPFQAQDIHKIASCLFIARTRSNGYT